MTNEELSDEVGKLLENIYYHFGEGSQDFANKHNLDHEQRWILEQVSKLRQIFKNGDFVLIADVKELQAKIDELEDERDELKDELDDAESKIETLQEENTRLEEENKALQAALDSKSE